MTETPKSCRRSSGDRSNRFRSKNGASFKEHHEDAALRLLSRNDIPDTRGHNRVRVQHQGSFQSGKRMLAELKKC